MMNKSVLFLILFVCFISCKNSYNDTIEWMRAIPFSSTIEYVKQHQPNFVDIYWDNPQIIENEHYYTVIPINEKNKDLKEYDIQIFFKSGKYQGYVIQ